MRPFYPALACAVFLVCALYSGAALATDPTPIEQRMTTLEESLKAQNQQRNDIQKKLDSTDQNSRDVAHTYEKSKLINEQIKNYDDKSLWLFMASVAVTTISLMILLGLLGYGIYTYKRMNEEVEKARADVETIRELKKEAEKESNKDKIERSEVFAAMAFSTNMEWINAPNEQKEKLWQYANDYYQRATDLNPNLAEAWNNWGALLNDKAKLTNNEKSRLDLRQRATDYYQKAISLRPDLAEAWFNLANRLRFSDQPQEAAKYYQKATELNPNDGESWRNWGVMLLDQAKKEDLDFDQKIKLLEQAQEKLKEAIALGFESSKEPLKQCEKEIAEFERKKAAGDSAETGRASTPPTANKEEGEEPDQG